MPPFYIGYSTIANIKKGYGGSVTSKRYRSVWRRERKNHPELFRTAIVSMHKTIEEARQKEIVLQTNLNVVGNELYINESIWPRAFNHSNRGVKFSEEFCRRSSEGHKGQIPWNKGIPCREETKEKLRLAKMGKKSGPCSELRRQNISAAKKGRSNGRKGMHHSENTKQKMRENALKYTHGIHTFSMEERQVSAKKANSVFKAKFAYPEYRKLHIQKIRYGRLKKRFDALLTAQTYYMDFTP
jgi:hypothetical protein